jgi:hypothetical protein
LKRTPLKPGTKPLSRSTPIQRKPLRPKEVVPNDRSISGQRVTGAVKSRPKKPKPKKKPALTKTKWRDLCDELFSLCVRAQGPCKAQGWRPPVDEAALLDLMDLPMWAVLDRLEELRAQQLGITTCLGIKQCAHIVSRGYMGTRWDFENAVVLCAGDHVYFTHHPEEWRLWVDLNFGPGYYDSIRRRALGYVARQEKPDYPATLARLVARAEELEIDTGKFRKHLPSNP